MKMLTVVLAICMLNIISCSNDNDAEIAELKNQIQELQQAQKDSDAKISEITPKATLPACTDKAYKPQQGGLRKTESGNQILREPMGLGRFVSRDCEVR